MSGTLIQKVAQRAKAFVADESGPAAVEYAVLLSLIIVVAMSAISQLGVTVRDLFGQVVDQIGSF
jgi:Flp pilus assembly pilin Flp